MLILKDLVQAVALPVSAVPVGEKASVREIRGAFAPDISSYISFLRGLVCPKRPGTLRKAGPLVLSIPRRAIFVKSEKGPKRQA